MKAINNNKVLNIVGIILVILSVSFVLQFYLLDNFMLEGLKTEQRAYLDDTVLTVTEDTEGPFIWENSYSKSVVSWDKASSGVITTVLEFDFTITGTANSEIVEAAIYSSFVVEDEDNGEDRRHHMILITRPDGDGDCWNDFYLEISNTNATDLYAISYGDLEVESNALIYTTTEVELNLVLSVSITLTPLVA